jgi:hypothetical protein
VTGIDEKSDDVPRISVYVPVPDLQAALDRADFPGASTLPPPSAIRTRAAPPPLLLRTGLPFVSEHAHVDDVVVIPIAPDVLS